MIKILTTVFFAFCPFYVILASEVSVNLSEAEDGILKSSFISWGDDEGELKLITPPNEDSMYDGPMNFFVSDKDVFIKEHLENRYLVIDRDSFMNIRYIPFSKTFDPKSLSQSELKQSSEIIFLRKKDSLFVVKKNAGKTLIMNFMQSGVKSLIFLKKDDENNLHMLAEKVSTDTKKRINVERYWLKTDKYGKVLRLVNLPQQKLYHPENDIFITDSGEIFMIVTVSSGLEIYRGGSE
ncbi:MAG: hypothetical protein R6W70_08080 [bacterium]